VQHIHLNIERSFAIPLQSIHHETEVTVSSVKSIPHQQCHVKNSIQNSERISNNSSVLGKKKTEKLVFVLDEAWFTLNRNVNSQNDIVGFRNFGYSSQTSFA
jgi:hypothetical protein